MKRAYDIKKGRVHMRRLIMFMLIGSGWSVGKHTQADEIYLREQAHGKKEMATLKFLEGKWEFDIMFQVSSASIDDIDVATKDNPTYIYNTLPTLSIRRIGYQVYLLNLA